MVSMPRLALLLALASFVALVPAGRAAAADVSVRVTQGTPDRYDDARDVRLSILARPGEANDIRLETVDAPYPSPTSVLVSDAGAPLTPGPGCAAEGANVRCSSPGDRIEVADVRLGDRSDRFVLVPANGAPLATVAGGAGDDELHAGDASGGPGDDTLIGGDASDLLVGGDGADTLIGGDGNDRLQGDRRGIARDRIDGGPGRDEVTYRGRRGPVAVDLSDPAPDGAPGEGDVLSSVEAIEGGAGDDDLRAGEDDSLLYGRSGDDRLTGGSRRDDLNGGLGDDRLQGGDGADELVGGPGADTAGGGSGDDLITVDRFDGTLRAGPGDDRVVLASTGGPLSRRSASRIACGRGRDLLFDPVDGMTVPRDCERLLGGDLVIFRPRVTASAVIVGVRVLRDSLPDPQRIELRTASGRLIGRRRFDFERSGRVRIRIPLRARLRTEAARRRLRLTVWTLSEESGVYVDIRCRVAPLSSVRGRKTGQRERT